MTTSSPEGRKRLSNSTDITVPEQLPIFPLASTVVFPSGVAALQIADERDLAMLDQLTEEGTMIGLFGVQDRRAAATEFEDFVTVGVAAQIVQQLKLGRARKQLLCHGLRRIELTGLAESEPYLIGSVSPVESEVSGRAVKVNSLMARALNSFRHLAAVDGRYSEEMVDVLEMNTEGGVDFFADLIGSLLAVPLEAKHRLILEVDPVARLNQVIDLMEEELAQAAVTEDIEERVRVQIEEKRREQILREQLQVIQKELGETSGPKREAEEYASMIEHLPIDEDSKKLLQRECDRLALMSERSGEYPAQSSYLDLVFRLPWWEKTDDSLDLKKVDRLLSRRHYGVDEVKERILEYLSVLKLKDGEIAGPILCFVGPPGTGKTTLVRSIAEAIGRRYINISLGGVADESEIRGHRKTYVGAMAGKIVSAYDRIGYRNPVVLLDEIDKLGKSMHGDPSAALLEVLDPEQNRTFVDRYLGVPFDLSDTLFIATANLPENIPAPLRDRMEILPVPGYTEEEKVEIARRFLRPKLLADHGLDRKALHVSSGAYISIVRNYTAEPGVRGLERRIATLCRRIAKKKAIATEESEPVRVRVNEKDLVNYFGPKIYEQEFAARNPEVGLATGLAWSAVGGAILFIEASQMAGSGKVEITGQLGDVMQESVRTAYSYVRSHAKSLEIPSDVFKSVDVHIHFPAGATPKDGPSAGIAVATCLASLLSGRPVRHEVAMTGEITLRGKVLSVGGIKEKVLAAHRARIKTVLLPIGNRKDLKRVPTEVREKMNLVFVDRVEQAWEEALMPLLLPKLGDVERVMSENASIGETQKDRRAAQPA